MSQEDSDFVIVRGSKVRVGRVQDSDLLKVTMNLFGTYFFISDEAQLQPFNEIIAKITREI